MHRLALILLSFAFAANAYAQAAPSDAQIEELLQVTHAQMTLATMSANMDQFIRNAVTQAVGNKEITPAEQKKLDAVVAAVTQTVHEQLTWDWYKGVAKRTYQQSFTAEELDGLIGFYKSPAGIAFVNKMPVVMQHMMGEMQAVMGPMMQKEQAAIQAALQKD